MTRLRRWWQRHHGHPTCRDRGHLYRPRYATTARCLPGPGPADVCVRCGHVGRWR